MSKENGRAESGVAELKAAAAELLRTLAGSEIEESDLFPFGVTRVSLTVKSGTSEIHLEIAGPDQPHFHDHSHDDDEDWSLVDDLPDLDDES
jgi:hypothetical protein